MENDDNKKYVSELVWLPTYLVIAILILGNIESGIIKTIAMFVALIGTRMILEFLYRLAFKERRLHLKTGIIAFLCQVMAWGGIIFLNAQLA